MVAGCARAKVYLLQIKCAERRGPLLSLPSREHAILTQGGACSQAHATSSTSTQTRLWASALDARTWATWKPCIWHHTRKRSRPQWRSLSTSGGERRSPRSLWFESLSRRRYRSISLYIAHLTTSNQAHRPSYSFMPWRRDAYCRIDPSTASHVLMLSHRSLPCSVHAIV